VEAQDIFLSDPALPSHSGAITGDLERKGFRHAVYVEIPTWAVRLRLLRPLNYGQTDRGRVLLLAGRGLSGRSSETSPTNPLLLNRSEQYVSLFCLLDADGDLFTAIYRHLLGRPTFTRADVGEISVEALKELRMVRLKNVSAGPLQQLRARIDRTIAAAQKQSGSGLGPKESIATPRTEPLVDCGILSKPHPDRYEYSFTKWGKAFLTELTLAPSVGNFLECRLSGVMASLTGHQRGTGLPPVRTLARCYAELRTGLGYVSLRELSLAAIAEGLSVDGAELFEITEIEQTLKKAASQNDRYVRLALGRTGGIAQVRIDQRAFAGE
jgi:hypothetical protein